MVMKRPICWAHPRWRGEHGELLLEGDGYLGLIPAGAGSTWS